MASGHIKCSLLLDDGERELLAASAIFDKPTGILHRVVVFHLKQRALGAAANHVTAIPMDQHHRFTGGVNLADMEGMDAFQNKFSLRKRPPDYDACDEDEGQGRK